MYVVRPSQMKDLDGLQSLARKTGIGLTTLPDDRPTLERKLENSKRAFESSGATDSFNTYLLVLEDLEKEIVIGTAAVTVGVGLERAFYNYRLLKQTQMSYNPPKRIDTELLHFANDFWRDTEVGTLFLDPDYRRDNLGKLLAKSRYMLMAAHPERFNEKVFAEMRGYVDENGASPFWEAIGSHFFGMPFKEADKISGMGNTQFIADLMPKYPIYTALLPATAQAVIGETQEAAKPAVRLLEKEGFRYMGAVDIFDAGPVMEVDRKSIWTVMNSKTVALGGSVDGQSKKTDHLVANPSIQHFCVTLSDVVDGSSGDVWLPKKVAESLSLKVGDRLCYAPLDYKKNEQQG